MEQLDNLKREQMQAIKNNDLKKLNLINKKIFEIRENKRKEKQKAQGEHLDAITDKKINIIINILK